MTSLVTGGNGYFGRLLVDRLVTQGEKVRVLDIDTEGAGGPGIEVVRGDIRDERAVREAVDGVEVVYHNVAQVPLARDAQLLRTVNVDGTANLLRAGAGCGWPSARWPCWPTSPHWPRPRAGCRPTPSCTSTWIRPASSATRRTPSTPASSGVGSRTR